jgi:hypothetical protein
MLLLSKRKDLTDELMLLLSHEARVAPSPLRPSFSNQFHTRSVLDNARFPMWFPINTG